MICNRDEVIDVNAQPDHSNQPVSAKREELDSRPFSSTRGGTGWRCAEKQACRSATMIQINADQISGLDQAIKIWSVDCPNSQHDHEFYSNWVRAVIDTSSGAPHNPREDGLFP